MTLLRSCGATKGRQEKKPRREGFILDDLSGSELKYASEEKKWRVPATLGAGRHFFVSKRAVFCELERVIQNKAERPLFFRQHPRSFFRYRDRIFKMRRERAVARGITVVVQLPDLAAAHIYHRFNGNHHAHFDIFPFATPSKIKDRRIFVKRPSIPCP